jgi:hypothetical protein
MGFGRGESQNSRSARQTSHAFQDDHGPAKEGDAHIKSGDDFELYFQANGVAFFSQPHFGLINGAGRRFSRE